MEIVLIVLFCYACKIIANVFLGNDPYPDKSYAYTERRRIHAKMALGLHPKTPNFAKTGKPGRKRFTELKEIALGEREGPKPFVRKRDKEDAPKEDWHSGGPMP